MSLFIFIIGRIGTWTYTLCTGQQAHTDTHTQHTISTISYWAQKSIRYCMCFLLVIWSLMGVELMCTTVNVPLVSQCVSMDWCSFVSIRRCTVQEYPMHHCARCVSLLEAGSWPVSGQVCVSGLKGDRADVCIWVHVAVTDWLSVIPRCPEICAKQNKHQLERNLTAQLLKEQLSPKMLRLSHYLPIHMTM